MTCKDCIHYTVCHTLEIEDCVNFKNKADFMEAVRCKDCKHLIVHNLPILYASCIKCHLRFEPFQFDTRTHFCSLGERKENND